MMSHSLAGGWSQNVCFLYEKSDKRGCVGSEKDDFCVTSFVNAPQM